MLITSKQLLPNQIEEIKSLLMILNNYMLIKNNPDDNIIPSKVLNATLINLDNYRILSVKKFNLDSLRDKGINEYD